jgi:biofilm PGA synthesis protein PgaD
MNPIIIDNPRLQSPRQRVFYSAITFVIWVAWVYIWLPLLSLVAWIFGYRLFYDEMIVKAGFQALVERIGNYSLVILVCGCVFVGWAVYNRLRFRGRERRHAAYPLTTEEVSEYFNVNPDSMRRWHGAKRLVVHHTDTGEIDQVDIRDLASMPDRRPQPEVHPAEETSL